MGVDALAAIVKTVEQDGLHEVDENDADAPEGSPEAEKDTACVEPDAKVAVIVFATEEPATTETLPELLSAKSKLLV